MLERSKAVKLTSFKKVLNGVKDLNSFSVKFFVSPTSVTESRNVSYVEISDIRQPASILVWMGSPSRNFGIEGRFIARTVDEADVAFSNLNLLKSWCVTNSTIGSGGTVNVFDSSQVLGETNPETPGDVAAVNNRDLVSTPEVTNVRSFSPSGLFEGTPEVLLLEGYGAQFKRIPVVITSLNISFSADVDYIKSTKGAWVPIYQEISIQLKEAREVSNQAGSIASFNLKKFREGMLEFW